MNNDKENASSDVARQRQESAPLVAEAIEHAARICESLCVCDNSEDDEEINRVLRNRAAQIRGLLDAKKAAATPSAAVAEGVDTALPELTRYTPMIAPFGYDYVVEMPERADGEYVKHDDALTYGAQQREAARRERDSEVARLRDRVNKLSVDVAEQSEAWYAVCEVLNELRPGWMAGARTGIDAAVATIRDLATPAPEQEAAFKNDLGWGKCQVLKSEAAQAERECTCPSGNGSLAWPCPQHPSGDVMRKAKAKRSYATKKASAPLKRCAAARDGDCTHTQCPQLRDNEPHASGRHCPLDTQGNDE